MTACGNSETPYVENKTQSVATAANSNGNFSNKPFGTGNNVSEAPVQEHMWEVIPEIPVTEASAFSYGYYDDVNCTGIVVTDYTGQSANVRIPGTFEGKPVVKS